MLKSKGKEKKDKKEKNEKNEEEKPELLPAQSAFFSANYSPLVLTSPSLGSSGNSEDDGKPKSRSNSTASSIDKEDEKLISAIQKRNISEIDAAIQSGGNVNAVDTHGKPILYLCDLNTMKHLVGKCKANVNNKSLNGWTSLHWFSKLGNVAVVEYLIQNGADVNIKAQFGITPLRAAIQAEKPEVVKLLIAKGAIINEPRDKDGAKTALHEACFCGNVEIIKILLENKADVNATCPPFMQTPLMEASFKGNLAAVKLLLDPKYKVNINTRDGAGHNALYYSGTNEHKAVTEYLLSQGASIKEVMKARHTLIHETAAKCSKEMMNLLLSNYKESIHVKDDGGNLPLHVAARFGNFEAAEALINAGSDISMKNSDGLSPEDIARHKKNEKFNPSKNYGKDHYKKLNKGRSAIVKLIEDKKYKQNPPENHDEDFLEGRKLLDKVTAIPKEEKSEPSQKDVNRANEAVKKFSNSIKKNPKSSWGYMYRAFAHKHNKETGKALEDVSQAITLDEKNPDLYNTRAMIHYGNNDPENAITDLQTAVTLDPTHAVAHKNLATALFNAGEVDEAYEEYIQAVKIENPKFRPEKIADTIIKKNKTFSGNNTIKLAHKSHKQYRILSIDGGGVRALIPAFILREIEEKTHKPITKSFDFLAGTSSGSVTALGLSKPSKDNPQKPMFTAAQICEIYSNHKNAKRLYQGFAATDVKKLFMSKYSRNGIDGLLDEYLGTVKLSDTIPDNMLVTAYEIGSHSAWNFTKREAILSSDFDFTLSEIARASSAAPTYFDPAVVRDEYIFLDGGLFANNPCLCSYLEAQQTIPREEMFILSLGTGSAKPHAKDVKKQASYWMQHLFTFVSLSTTSNTDNYMKMLFPETGRNDQQYFRFQATLNRKIPLDGVSKEEVKVLIETAEELIENLYADHSLNRVIEKLLQE